MMIAISARDPTSKISLLHIASRCGLERLQEACITEILLALVNKVRDARYSGHSYTNHTAQTFDELFSYDLHPEARNRLGKAISLLLGTALDGNSITWVVAVDRAKVEEIMMK